MEAGLTDQVWTLEELIALLPETKPNEQANKELVKKALERGNYGKEPSFDPVSSQAFSTWVNRLRALNVTQLKGTG